MLISKLTKGFNVNGFTSKAAAIRYLKARGTIFAPYWRNPKAIQKLQKMARLLR
jgi:hypothetical protein